jgi:nitrogen fixation protein FixH
MQIRVNWGVAVAIAYTVFAAGTLGFAVFAMEQPVDLVSPDYYEQSLKQDDRMAAVARVQAMGDTFSAALSADEVAVAIPPAARVDVTGTITMYRPSDAAADRSVPLRVNPDGVARMGVGELARGHWILKVSWQARGQGYYYEHPVELP